MLKCVERNINRRCTGNKTLGVAWKTNLHHCINVISLHFLIPPFQNRRDPRLIWFFKCFLRFHLIVKLDILYLRKLSGQRFYMHIKVRYRLHIIFECVNFIYVEQIGKNLNILTCEFSLIILRSYLIPHPKSYPKNHVLI